MVALAAPIVMVEPLPVRSSVAGLSGLLAGCAALLVENERLRGEVGRLGGENERLRGRVAELEGRVEGLRRSAKRQAAPFSRGKPKEKPGRAGRKPGEEYGKKAHRAAPDRVDETLEAPLGDRCECGGEIEFERFSFQYQEELPEPRPIVRRIKIHIGRCRGCRRRHQGRHPFQTSDALGAAASMLGPRAVALATVLNKELGLSPQKTAGALLELGGIAVTAGGVVHAIARQGRALEPTYGALVEAVRASKAVAPDETGWRVEARKRWLWAFVGDGGVTVYLIASRGYADAKRILGEDFAGVLERDGWASYRLFEKALHQSCCGHLLKRCGELIEDSLAGQARVPHTVRRLLLDALALRDRYAWLLAADGPLCEAIEGEAIELDSDHPGAHRAPLALEAPADQHQADTVEGEAIDAGVIEGEAIELDSDDPGAHRAPLALPAPADQHQADTVEGEVVEGEVVEGDAAAARSLAAARAELQARLDRLLARKPAHEPNRKLLAHLRREREHLLTFLSVPGVQATNWRAEQAIRPAVVNRKSWGGNKTWQGARTQEITMSVLRTARQQQTDPVALMAEAQLHRTPTATTRLRLPTARSDPALAAQADR